VDPPRDSCVFCQRFGIRELGTCLFLIDERGDAYVATPVILVFVADVIEGLPEEELRFLFLAGRPCLNLAATVGERWRRSFERLRTPEDLGRWLVEAGMAVEPPAVGQAELEAARALRDAIYRAAKLAGRGALDPDDVVQINRWATAPAPVPQLDADRRVSWVCGRPVHAALASLARDAIDLLSGPLAVRVRECAAKDCALLFVDASRPGRRRWCSMEGCGNRAKTTRYRRRQAKTTTKTSPA
jgi:predicted RNA-binding Zn ribbon-like protein